MEVFLFCYMHMLIIVKFNFPKRIKTNYQVPSTHHKYRFQIPCPHNPLLDIRPPDVKKFMPKLMLYATRVFSIGSISASQWSDLLILVFSSSDSNCITSTSISYSLF